MFVVSTSLTEPQQISLFVGSIFVLLFIFIVKTICWHWQATHVQQGIKAPTKCIYCNHIQCFEPYLSFLLPVYFMSFNFFSISRRMSYWQKHYLTRQKKWLKLPWMYFYRLLPLGRKTSAEQNLIFLPLLSLTWRILSRSVEQSVDSGLATITFSWKIRVSQCQLCRKMKFKCILVFLPRFKNGVKVIPLFCIAHPYCARIIAS